jgi:hypothetical protein
MIEFEDFSKLIDEIMLQGYTRDQAGDMAALIGDTPVLDADGNFLVIGENGETLATLKPLRFFTDAAD